MKLRFLAALAAVLLVGVSAFAQTTGTLTGNVTLGGNPLPGVTVTVSSPNLIGTRTTVSDSNGNYTFGALPPGDYTIRFDMESMQAVTRTTRVGLAGTARADAEMKLTSVAEAITVTASAPAVLETTEVQTNITAQLVTNLPLARDLRGTVGLAPGVNNNGPGGNQVISGAPSFDNLYMIDGAVVNENLRGQPHDLFIEDAIQETTVLTGGISAEFGRFTGGVVTAISKTGGNEFSGTFRDSFQSPKWSALSPGDVTRRTKNINQTYEATLGGRIIRDRLWFFTAGRSFERNNPLSTFGNGPSFIQGREQTRLELKLTGQVTPKHSLTVSSLDITDKQTNNAFPSAALTYELSALDTARETPNDFLTAHYNGVITNSFLIEANASRKNFSFVESGGDAFGDLAYGTNVFDYVINANGVALGAPTFCGSCGGEERNNRNWSVKSTYYLSTSGLGTHNIVTGYDDWHATRKGNNHQSASDWTVGIYSPGTTRGADGRAIHNHDPAAGSVITMIWWPILESSKGTSLDTQSFFVNDKWDFNNRLSFNLGARYDKNTGEDSSHASVADDSKITPRLGMVYDVRGNGRLRVNASYSQYVAAIADGNVADAASPAGSPSYLYWIYYGPAVNNATTPQLLQTMFDWLKSVGFTTNKDFLLGGKTNGLGSRIPEPLESPYVGEWTLGLGTQIGSRGFIRADYIDRKWRNFYTGETNLSNGKVFDPLAQREVDVSFVKTTNGFERKYNALQLQGSYQPFSRLNLGANYTWSELKGNHGAETAGSGPVANSGFGDFPEYIGYANRLPIGYLGSDQRHKVRGWASYDQPTPIGNFNVSLLQNYDSGVSFSATGLIDPRRFFCDAAHAARPASDIRSCAATAIGTRGTVRNPGYDVNGLPTSATYFFSDRGAFRTDDITSSNLAVNWSAPRLFGKVQFYVETEVRNLFDESGVVNVNTTTFTNRNTTALRAFDPFVDTPIECPQIPRGVAAGTYITTVCAPMGAHWVKGADWGQPLTRTSFDQAGDYQLPRTFLFSAGLRF